MPRPQMKNKQSDIHRSDIMRSVKSRDTTPEMIVRRFLHRLGYRFRLHRKDLAGTPDLVLPRMKMVVFVHGCFWHGHNCARGGRLPKSNRDYWIAKITRNRERDQLNRALLQAEGWKVCTVWECEIKNLQKMRELAAFLKSSEPRD